MGSLTLSLGSLTLILVLIALRLPIGVAMGVVAVGGFWYLRDVNVALRVLGDTPFSFAASWDLSSIPMFLLMGAIAGNAGIGDGLFRAAQAWFGRLPGGLAIAANWACAGFGAASGSSVAEALRSCLSARLGTRRHRDGRFRALGASSRRARYLGVPAPHASTGTLDQRCRRLRGRFQQACRFNHGPVEGRYIRSCASI